MFTSPESVVRAIGRLVCLFPCIVYCIPRFSVYYVAGEWAECEACHQSIKLSFCNMLSHQRGFDKRGKRKTCLQ